MPFLDITVMYKREKASHEYSELFDQQDKATTLRNIKLFALIFCIILTFAIIVLFIKNHE